MPVNGWANTPTNFVDGRDVRKIGEKIRDFASSDLVFSAGYRLFEDRVA